MMLMSIFCGCLFMMLCFNISSFDFVNNQFQCSTSATIMFDTCIIPYFIIIMVICFSFSCWSIVSFDYHTCLMVSGPTFSSNDSLIVLKLCSLNLVANKLDRLKLHRIVFGVSRILLIVGFQGLLNLLLTNRWVNLWKSVLKSTFSNLCVLWKNPWHV